MELIRIHEGDCASSRDVLVRSVESGADQVLVDADALPPTFFNLSSGEAGDLVQAVAMHGIQMAVVVPDLGSRTKSFQEFAREVSRGQAFRVMESEARAEEWLRSRLGQEDG